MCDAAHAGVHFRLVSQSQLAACAGFVGSMLLCGTCINLHNIYLLVYSM